MSKIGVVFVLLSVSAFAQSSGAGKEAWYAAQSEVVQVPEWGSSFEPQDHWNRQRFDVDRLDTDIVVDHFQWSPHTKCSIPLQEFSIPTEKDFAIRQTAPRSDGTMRFVDPPAPVCTETPSIRFHVPIVPERPGR